MKPTTVPGNAQAFFPSLELIDITSPPDVPEEECGTVNALLGKYVGGVFDGGDYTRSYWKVSPEEAAGIVEGAVIELVIFGGMPPHTLNVWNPDAPVE